MDRQSLIRNLGSTPFQHCGILSNSTISINFLTGHVLIFPQHLQHCEDDMDATRNGSDRPGMTCGAPDSQRTTQSFFSKLLPTSTFKERYVGAKLRFEFITSKFGTFILKLLIKTNNSPITSYPKNSHNH